MDNSQFAKQFADQLEQVMESDGYKIFMAQVDREIRAAEVDLMTVGRDPSMTSEQITMFVRDHQGYLRGLLRMKDMPKELLGVLHGGRVPWMEKP